MSEVNLPAGRLTSSYPMTYVCTMSDIHTSVDVGHRTFLPYSIFFISSLSQKHNPSHSFLCEGLLEKKAIFSIAIVPKNKTSD